MLEYFPLISFLKCVGSCFLYKLKVYIVFGTGLKEENKNIVDTIRGQLNIMYTRTKTAIEVHCPPYNGTYQLDMNGN